MIALRRRDVAELNAIARGLMDASGRLGDERIRAAGREFAVGDRIVCGRTGDNHRVRNGTRGTIVALDPASRTVTIATDAGQSVLTTRYLDSGFLRHGYALTGHSVQGTTTHRAYVLGSDRAAQE